MGLVAWVPLGLELAFLFVDNRGAPLAGVMSLLGPSFPRWRPQSDGSDFGTAGRGLVGAGRGDASSASNGREVRRPLSLPSAFDDSFEALPMDLASCSGVWLDDVWAELRGLGMGSRFAGALLEAVGLLLLVSAVGGGLFFGPTAVEGVAVECFATLPDASTACLLEVRGGVTSGKSFRGCENERFEGLRTVDSVFFTAVSFLDLCWLVSGFESPCWPTGVLCMSVVRWESSLPAGSLLEVFASDASLWGVVTAVPLLTF